MVGEGGGVLFGLLQLRVRFRRGILDNISINQIKSNQNNGWFKSKRIKNASSVEIEEEL